MQHWEALKCCMIAYCNSPARNVLLSGPWLSLRSSVCTVAIVCCHQLIDCTAEGLSCCSGKESTSGSFTLCQFRVCKTNTPASPVSRSQSRPCTARLFQLLLQCATKLVLCAFDAMVFIHSSSTTVFANASRESSVIWRDVAPIKTTH